MRRLPPSTPKPTQPEGETGDPLIADHRNFYKVEKWTKDGSKVDYMLYAGSSLDKAREVFAEAIYHRPRIRLTISSGHGRRRCCDKLTRFGPEYGCTK